MFILSSGSLFALSVTLLSVFRRRGSSCNTGVVTQCVCSAEKSDRREEPLDQSRKRRARRHRHIADARFSAENGGVDEHSFCSQRALLHGGGRGEADAGGGRARGRGCRSYSLYDVSIMRISPVSVTSSFVHLPALVRSPASMKCFMGNSCTCWRGGVRGDR